MTLYTDRKPREAVARAICTKHGYDPDRLEAGDVPKIDGYLRNGDPAHFMWRQFIDEADAVLNLIRSNGWGSDLLLDAIHAEEDANGEPRSSVVPGAPK